MTPHQNEVKILLLERTVGERTESTIGNGKTNERTDNSRGTRLLHSMYLYFVLEGAALHVKDIQSERLATLEQHGQELNLAHDVITQPLPLNGGRSQSLADRYMSLVERIHTRAQ